MYNKIIKNGKTAGAYSYADGSYLGNMDTETLTCKVCEARADYGITQQQLADATGISVRTIISIEKGRQFPTLLSAMRIAHYFSLSVDQLFEYKYDDNSEKENTNDKR